MNAIAGFLSRSCHVLTIEELAREAIGTQKSHKHWVYMVGANIDFALIKSKTVEVLT